MLRSAAFLGGPGYNAEIVLDTLASLLAIETPTDRTAAVAEWLQRLYDDTPPVLVGGSAVELYTGGAYVSGDLDFVGDVPESVARRLREAGFRKLGRHWVLEEAQLFVEFPGTRLEPSGDVVDLHVGGAVVRVLAPEPLIVNCLAAWQHWSSAQDGVNALLVARSAAVDRAQLRRLAEVESVAAACAALEQALDRFDQHEPKSEELVQWANEIPSE